MKCFVACAAICITLSSSAASRQGSVSALKPADLKCEYRSNPLGIDVAKPRLSWILASSDTSIRGELQTAYRVLVATDPVRLASDKADLWDTGKRVSDQTVHIVYDGAALSSRMRCYWKVMIWDLQDRASSWSETAHWSMGLLNPAEWGAQWIADPEAAVGPEAEAKAVEGVQSGYRSYYAGSQDTQKWVAIDLGQPRQIDAVRLYPTRPWNWHPDMSAYYFPLRFRIEAASKADFSDARTVVDRTQRDEPNPDINAEAPLYKFAPVTARHVRLTATRLRAENAVTADLALAEMEVLAGGNNVAQGAAVSALDSLEAPGWSKAYLVDGRRAAVAGTRLRLPVAMLRKAFSVSGAIKRATVYITALGVYELRLNGERVGDHILAPEWTDYNKRVQWQCFDVTKAVRSGNNVVGALLGEGWYSGLLGLVPTRRNYGSLPKLLLRLEIEMSNGQTLSIVTDQTWHVTTDGPIISSGIFDGEIYDARREMPGWDEPGFDDKAWRQAHAETDFTFGELVWQPNEPIRVVSELKPVRVSEPKPGVYVFDLGQNMVGWCRLKLQGKAGTIVRLRHAEMIHADGTIYTANLTSALATDYYTLRGGDLETFEPHFTYHGFRYVELTGLTSPPKPDAIVGRVFHSAAPEAGKFESSSEMLNRLMNNILWTLRGNMHGVLTDCPQRQERAGWMGDMQAFSQTAIFSMDMGSFFTKRVRDMRDDQKPDGRFPDIAPHPFVNGGSTLYGSPAWADAGTIVPWRLYQNYADAQVLDEHFGAAKRWIDFVASRNPNLLWDQERGLDYNDWLSADSIVYPGWPTSGGEVPKPVFATAFFAHSTDLVARMAAVLGRSEDSKRYRELFEKAKAAFNRAYVDSEGHIRGNTQGGYALALQFELLPEPLRPKAARYLVEGFKRYDGHLSTGIQTTHRLMLELTRYGFNDEAYRLLNLRSFPSWGFMIDQGATTIWERWDGYVHGRGFQDPGMNSFNHVALGSVGEWIWRTIVGINPDDTQPGYKHFIIHPWPGGGLTWARGIYRSIRGTIISDWKIEAGKLVLKVTVPFNTTATLFVPTHDTTAVMEGGKPTAEAIGVKSEGVVGGAARYRVTSGTYTFTAPF